VAEAIPLSARIVALADVFDALVMKRPYKAPWPIERVMATFATARAAISSRELVQLFESILPRILAIKAAWGSEGARTGQPSVASRACPG
jgi:putative two-component system response regulator